MPINFKISPHEHDLIAKVANRTVALARQHRIPYSIMDASMDVTACHANGCELRLEELIEAADFDFIHDVFGIRRHLNRTTGKLDGCFVPRFAVRGES